MESVPLTRILLLLLHLWIIHKIHGIVHWRYVVTHHVQRCSSMNGLILRYCGDRFVNWAVQCSRVTHINRLRVDMWSYIHFKIWLLVDVCRKTVRRVPAHSSVTDKVTLLKEW